VNYGYAHYELGRAELKAARGPEKSAHLAEAERQLRRALVTYTDYFRPNGPASLDKMRQDAGQPVINRADDVTMLTAKSHWRLSQVCDLRGQPAEATVERSEALRLRSDAAQLVATEDREVGK